MEQEIRELIDKIVPRGGEKPDAIHVSLEEYLSRLSSLNRKLVGVKYRKRCWDTICAEHISEFEKTINRADFIELSEQNRITTVSFSKRDARIENEFEIFLYSLSSSLSSLARVIACFTKGATHNHSHSKLANILIKYNDFKESHSLVVNAMQVWSDELVVRRDASTHYFALGVTSSVTKAKQELLPISKVVLRFGIPKIPKKYNSLWEDELPTSGGSQHKTITFDTGYEEHELMDSNGVIVVRRNSPLPTKPGLIDGEKYVQNLYNTFQQ